MEVLLIVILIIALLAILVYGGLLLAAVACAILGLVVFVIGLVKRSRPRDKSTDDSEACIYGGIALFVAGVVGFALIMGVVHAELNM